MKAIDKDAMKLPDPAMVDQQWRGYDLRAAVPAFALASVLTVAIMASRFYEDDLGNAVFTYAIVLILWPALLFVAVYRSVTYTYRITDRALLVDRGFLHRPIPPLHYADISSVEHGASWFYSWLRIGWVHVTAVGRKTVRMPSLRDPAAFAKLLSERIEAAKGL
jgi:uncharacterized membrane protein YdbT with pleckstrin-like domain